MPRANRHFLSGHVWHITYRYHQRDFLLKFARNRVTYLRWLFEARKRHGLCVLNYAVTSNHVHLLDLDNGTDGIAQSMQLVAGRTAQQYNQRKARQGAFWQDRYHATAIETDEHLHRCLVYLDLNRVRAGAVRHPSEWIHGGYQEIQNPPDRYRIVDLAVVSALCGFSDIPTFQMAHRKWVDDTLRDHATRRDDTWSSSIAVGSAEFIDQIKAALGISALHREVVESQAGHSLRQPQSTYASYSTGENSALRLDNTFPWEQ